MIQLELSGTLLVGVYNDTITSEIGLRLSPKPEHTHTLGSYNSTSGYIIKMCTSVLECTYP